MAYGGAKEEKRYIPISDYFFYARTHYIAYTRQSIISPRLEESHIRESKELTPREYLEKIAGENFDLIDRVVQAESGWDQNANNPKSTASGLAQYLDSTFLRFCVDKYGLAKSLKDKNNPYIQLKCMILMINDGGITHWNPSRAYWDF